MMRRLWRNAVSSAAALAATAVWAQELTPDDLAGRQRAAFGLLFTMLGGLLLTYLLMRLLGHRERAQAKQAEEAPRVP
jgi:hypothetical protein